MVGNDAVNFWDYLGLRCCKDECPSIGARQNVHVVRIALSRGDIQNDPNEMEQCHEMLKSINMVSNVSSVGGIAGGATQGAGGALLNAAQSQSPTPGSGLGGMAIEMGAGIQHQQAMNLSARIHVYVEWEECEERKCPRGPSSSRHRKWTDGHEGEHTCTFGNPPIPGRDITDAQRNQCIQAAIQKFSK